MVIRLLDLLGTYLGPQENLLPPNEHNPGGYWEHQDIVHLNEAILECLGGSWHEPPEFHGGWEGSPELAALRSEARAVVRRDFQGVPLWGWKDPRNCLTLPFWRKLVPNISCIVCLRNPVDVGSSLQRVHGFSTTKCLDLWLRYAAASFENSSGLPRLLISYEDLFEDWWGETQRLARFIGVPLDGGRRFKEEIHSVIETEFWHHRSTVIDALDTPELAMPAKSLYFTLRSLTKAKQDKAYGYVESRECQESLDILSRYAATEQRRLAKLEAENSILGERLTEKERALAKLEAENSMLGERLTEKERALVERDGLLAKNSREIARLEKRLRATEEQLHRVRHEWHLATSSVGYRLLEWVRRPIRWLAPEGTRRRLAFIAFSRGLNIILTQGPWAFLRRGVQVWRWLPRLRRSYLARQVVDLNEKYQLWLKAHELTPARTWRIRQQAARLSYRPLMSIIMPVYNPDPAWLHDAIRSVRDQLYDNWELCIADDGSTYPGVHELLEESAKGDECIKVTYLKQNQGISAASNAALALATGEFIGLLDNDDELTPDALFEVVKLLNERPDLDFIYSDEDKKRSDGRRVEPFFKPDWSPDLEYSSNYVTHFSVYRREIVERVGGLRLGFEGSQDYDLTLRVAELIHNIGHIRKVLYTWRMVPGSAAATSEAKPYAYEAAKKALAESLERRGIDGRVEDGRTNGWYRIRYRIRGDPLVSIIIPTRDRADLLRKCLNRIAQSSYKRVEVIVVDNGSVEEATRALLESRELNVVRDDGPFNFSRLINAGGAAARGDFLLLMNNDVEAIKADWIEAMLEHAQRRQVGVVGARLLFPDGRPQHEGVALGIGGTFAGHIDWRDYLGLSHAVRNCSAVTAACAMTRRSVFDELGGFDEAFRAAYGDVDYCLRARERGHLVVYTPYALLYHHESASRGKESPPEDEKLARQRWGHVIDPYYNYALDEVWKPWVFGPPAAAG